MRPNLAVKLSIPSQDLLRVILYDTVLPPDVHLWL